MLIFEKTMPNGAVAQYHKAVRFEVQDTGTHAVVSSYHSEEMELISWQDTYVIPSVLAIHSLDDIEFVLASVGAPFAGATIVPSEAASFSARKARLKARIKIERDKREAAGVTTTTLTGVPEDMTGPWTFQSDPDSQRKISGAVLSAVILQGAFQQDWRLADDAMVPLNATDMITVGMLIMQHVSACQLAKNALDELVDGANTEEALASIDINSGWPA